MKLGRKFSKIILVGSTLMLGLTAAGCSASANAAANNTTMVSSIQVTDSVEASGVIEAGQYAALAWKTTGTVGDVNVSSGDLVSKGDVLASLDVSSVPANVISAQADVISAGQQVDNLLQPDGATVTKAEQQVASAFSSWNDALNNLKSTASSVSSSGDSGYYTDFNDSQTDLLDALNTVPLASAGIDVQAYFRAAREAAFAQASLQDAQDAYDQSRDNDALHQAVDLADEQYQSALAEKNAFAENLDDDVADDVDEIVDALVSYHQNLSDFAESIDGTNTTAYSIRLEAAASTESQAEEAVMTSIQSLYELEVQPDADDLAAAQAKLQAAQSTANNLNLIAPFDGEILNVNTESGEQTSTSEAAIQMANMNELRVSVLVDETEIAKVTVGDSAEITLDALPGVVLTGKVTDVVPVGQVISGLVKYTVRVTLDPTDETVLLGATANVTILVSSAQSALAVPISAVQSDAQSEYVYKVNSDGSSTRVNIVSGALVGDKVVVNSGDLVEGDVIEASPASGMSQRFMGGGN